MKRFSLVFVLAMVLASQFASLLLTTSIVSAEPEEEPAETERQQIIPERGDFNEYYYYDGDTVVGKAGQYKDEVKFKLDEGRNTIYIVDGASMEVNPNITKNASSTCDSGSVPTKLWAKEGEKPPGFYLNMMASAGLELDLKDDNKDGGDKDEASR